MLTNITPLPCNMQRSQWARHPQLIRINCTVRGIGSDKCTNVKGLYTCKSGCCSNDFLCSPVYPFIISGHLCIWYIGSIHLQIIIRWHAEYSVTLVHTFILVDVTNQFIILLIHNWYLAWGFHTPCMGYLLVIIFWPAYLFQSYYLLLFD